MKINDCSLISILAMRMERTNIFDMCFGFTIDKILWVVCAKGVKKWYQGRIPDLGLINQYILTGYSNKENVYHGNKVSDLDMSFLRCVLYLTKMLSWL